MVLKRPVREGPYSCQRNSQSTSDTVRYADSVNMIHDLIEEKKHQEKEGQGRPDQLTETLEPIFGLKQMHCHYLSPGFLKSLLTGFDFFYSSYPLTQIHSPCCSRVISLKFKTAFLWPNLSTVLRIRSCIICPMPTFLFISPNFPSHQWPFSHNDLLVP